ncbi:hypothetical protein [Rhizobium sp. L51/94]|uniref:hypothetical protein n=1 Tax=Rhizobium sp. L51/94 TaxID=2819999 RepID=UPI001C5B0D4C|nr:hypothetical protein [Rhizobium sp. L51/94]QXZ79664.1 hypothetical protein J5274_06690 [Rhizobium sp. L51/94]
MKMFLPTVSFTFPEGSITRFEAGIMSLPITDEEADLLEAKGLGTANAVGATDAQPAPAEVPASEPVQATEVTEGGQSEI